MREIRLEAECLVTPRCRPEEGFEDEDVDMEDAEEQGGDSCDEGHDDAGL